MKTRALTAIKPHKYGTRHLTAGEEYEVPVKHALALVAGKKARFAAPRPPSELPPPPVRDVANPEPVVGSEVRVELDELRREAERLGVEVDRRWGVVRLRHEIAKAKG
jgi:hypothetical protein